MWLVIGVYICIVLSFFAGWICRVGMENANKRLIERTEDGTDL